MLSIKPVHCAFPVRLQAQESNPAFQWHNIHTFYTMLSYMFYPVLSLLSYKLQKTVVPLLGILLVSHTMLNFMLGHHTSLLC